MSYFYEAESSTKGTVVIIGLERPEIISQVTYVAYNNFTHVSDIIQDNPAFDNTLTIFCSTQQQANALLSYGFSNPYVLDSNEIITFKNDNRIEKISNGFRYVLSNNTVVQIVTFGSRYQSQSFESFPASNYEVSTTSTAVLDIASRIRQYDYYISHYVVNPESQVTPVSTFTIVGFQAVNKNILYDVEDGADMALWFTGLAPDLPTTDPFAPGGESEPGGGTGDFDGTSDPIDFPDLPTLSATDAGFITLFNPSALQLKALASYMWSNSLFDLATWKKIFADPMDAILGLTIVPVDVPAGGTGAVKVGNISTDVNMTYASTQYVEVDCGTLNVNEYWGAYLDYEPFTKAEIYLPYIGTHAIAVDDIMGKAVHVKYHIDILSGACAAYVKCGDSVLYTFIGQCASSIPITGSDMTNVINGVISAAVSIGTMVATGGASAPVSVPALANTAVNQMKPSIEKSGSMSGTGGMLGIQTPYLILTRPRQCLPAAQNEFMGYPSFISSVMGDLSGYTEVEQVHLDGIAATDAEISEIENLLKSGVIF